MIRKCTQREFEVIYSIINEASQAYKGVIPGNCWQEPYMSREELRREMAEGVRFWGYELDGQLAGVMGSQQVWDVTLIRHAYVRVDKQKQGIGGQLLSFLCAQTRRPVLIGTWADAFWAVDFYRKHGFRMVSAAEKDRLLRKYWSIPEGQRKTSVVLGDVKYFSST